MDNMSKIEQEGISGGMPAVGAAPQSAEGQAEGGLSNLGTEMGGGGEGEDATAKWAAQKGGYEELLRQIQQNGWGDNLVWKLPDGTQVSVAEIKQLAAAATASPAPEPQQFRSSKLPESIPTITVNDSKKNIARRHWRGQLARGDLVFDDLTSWRIEIEKVRREPFDKSKWASWIKSYDGHDVVPDRLLLDLDREILQRVMDDQGVSYGDSFLDGTKLEKLRKEQPRLVEPVLRALQEEFRKADMLSELPIGEEGKKDILSPQVDFRAAFNRLMSLMRNQNIQMNGIGEQNEEDVLKRLEKVAPAERVAELKKLMSDQQRYAAMAAEMGMEPDLLTMGGAMRDLAAYVFEPEIDKALRLAEDLTQNQRNQWVARLTGGMLRAGRAAARAGIYLSALGGDEDASSIESAIAKGQALVERIISMAGYLKPEQLHQGAQFFKPEEIGALNETPIRFAAWIREPGQTEAVKKVIEICPKDILATMYRTDVMRELLANRAAENRGYWTARGKWFKYTFWRRAGYTEEQARGFVTGELESPELMMTNQLAMTTRRNINSLDRWLGENWWMIMEAEATFSMSRSDYGMMPIDEFARRLFIGLRSTEQADYVRLYDLGDPFLQEFGGIIYLPEYFSLIAEDAMVKPLVVEARRNTDGTTLNLKNPEERKIFGLRKKCLERLIMIDQPSPAVVREMAKMALGIGEYQPNGAKAEEKIADWKKKVADGMRVIDKTGIKRMRLPEFWRFVGSEHLALSPDRSEANALVERAWKDFDFSPWLKQEGLLEAEIATGPSVGIAGWERFKQHASIRLMRMMNAQWRDYDKAFRYLVKLGGNLDQLEKLFDMNLESNELRPAQIGTSMAIGESQARLHILSLYIAFMEELTKAGEELVVGDFIPSDNSQRMYRALLKGFRDTHCAFDLDKVHVEAVEVDKVGAGTTFSVRRIDKKVFDERWRAILASSQLTENEVLHFLNGFQLYFVESVEMEEKRMEEQEMPEEERKTFPILVGPQTGFVPEVITPRKLYSELRDITKKRLKDIEKEYGVGLAQYDVDYRGLREFLVELDSQEKENAFCWSRLREGTWSLPPEAIADLTNAVDKKASLSNAVSATLVKETQDLIESGKLKGFLLADGGWRMRFIHPSIGTKLWLLGSPGIKRDVKIERK